jgi:hypothetical protein
MEAMNAYQQITAAVTPAVMVSACGLIALGLDNQISRMGLRLRELAREHRDEGVAPERRAAVARQVAVLDRRHGLYFRALILNYGALFAFVATSLLWLGQGLAPVPAELPLVVFAMGLVMLAALAVLVIAAIHLARRTIGVEAAEVAGTGGDRRAPPGATPARA